MPIALSRRGCSCWLTLPGMLYWRGVAATDDEQDQWHAGGLLLAPQLAFLELVHNQEV